MKNRQIHRNDHGLTLSELLVVIALVGILSLIALPQFSSLKSNLEVSQDAREFATVLARVRAEAIRLRSEITVTFTSTGASWTVQGDADPAGSYALGAKSSWSTVPSTLTFDGLGLVSGLTSPRTLTLTDGPSQISITINPNGHLRL